MYFSIKHFLIVIIPLKTCADPERAPWDPYPAPRKMTRLYDSLAPLENHKAFNVGPCSTRQRKAIAPFKWCFADRPMMAHLKWYWDHQLKKNARVGAVWPPFWMRMEELLTEHLRHKMHLAFIYILTPRSFSWNLELSTIASEEGSDESVNMWNFDRAFSEVGRLRKFRYLAFRQTKYYRWFIPKMKMVIYYLHAMTLIQTTDNLKKKVQHAQIKIFSEGFNSDNFF